MSRRKLRRKKILFSLLLLFSFTFGLFPGASRATNAEETNNDNSVISESVEKEVAEDEKVPVEGEKGIEDGDAIEAEEPKVEEPKVEEPKVEEPKVEEPKVEEPKVDEPKVEEPKVEEPEVEEPKIDKSKLEETKVESSGEEFANKNQTNHAKPIVNYSNFSPMKSRYILTTNSLLQDTIEVTKTAERQKDNQGKKIGCRTFEVTLGITGTPPKVPVDVVLVIDRSGSMAEGDANDYMPINQSPDISKDYFVKVNGSYTEVSRSGNTWTYGSRWDRRHVKWDVNGDDDSPGVTNQNNAIGKPFYVLADRMYYAKQAAADFAAKVLGPNGIPGNRVSIVSFSGIPKGTGSQNQASTDQELTSSLIDVNLAIAGLNALGGTNTQAGFLEGKSVIQNSGNPNSNKIVIMLTDGLPTYSNGNTYLETTDLSNIRITRAITAGKSIFNPAQGEVKADLFSIGLLQGMSTAERGTALNILNQTQNKGFKEAPTAQDLDDIFDEISDILSYSAENAMVKDKVGDEFHPVLPLPAGATYDDDPNSPEYRVITWNPGTIGTKKEYKYIVRANSTFVGGMAEEEKVPTNEYAELTYKDINGNEGRKKTFPVPKVNVPTLIKVSLTDASIFAGNSINLGIGTDKFGENYMSPVIGGDNDGTTFTYEWRIFGNDTVIFTDKNPEVSPSLPTKYEVTVIDSNGCKARATMTVSVNVIKRTVTATKTWVNGPEAHPTIWFKLYRAIAGADSVEVPNVSLEKLVNGVTEVNWENIDATDNDGNSYIFSVVEGKLNGSTFEPGDPENYISSTQDGLNIKNTYMFSTVTVSKVVAGNLGDKNKRFKFTANLSGDAKFSESSDYKINPSDSSEATFTLQNGESVNLIVPVGAKLSIAESDNAGYEVTVMKDDISIPYPNLTITVPDESTEIKFTNTINTAIETGVTMDSLPYVLILALIGMGGFSGLVSKRKRENFN